MSLRTGSKLLFTCKCSWHMSMLMYKVFDLSGFPLQAVDSISVSRLHSWLRVPLLVLLLFLQDQVSEQSNVDQLLSYLMISYLKQTIKVLSSGVLMPVVLDKLYNHQLFRSDTRHYMYLLWSWFSLGCEADFY